MATNFYETLGVSTNATPEQIRKAYKRKALQTHPDRLPPGTSAEEKAASEDLFRKVNNAYEVLTDQQKRREYDSHGVWPPPGPGAAQSSSHRGAYGGYRPHERSYNSMNDWFQDPWHPRSSFGFTDPFTLFDNIFDDIFPGSRGRRHRHDWFASELARMMDDGFDAPHRAFEFPSFGRGLLPPQQLSSFGASFGAGNRGQWQSESYVSKTINGVTQTSHKRRDWNGDEHVTHTYADGRKVHMINGVQQPPSGGYLPTTDGHNAPPPPPPYPGNPGPAGHGTTAMIADRPYGQDRRFSETHPALANNGESSNDKHRRWWPGGRQ